MKIQKVDEQFATMMTNITCLILIIIGGIIVFYIL